MNDFFARISRKRADSIINMRWAREEKVPKICLRLTQILDKEGFIKNWELTKLDNAGGVSLKIRLKEEIIMRGLSKSSRRRYVSAVTRATKLRGPSKHVPGYIRSTTIMSTTAGLLTEREARALNLGGELICVVASAK